METNGWRVTPEIAAALASSKNPFVSVSLDGTDAPDSSNGVRGVEGCFDAAIAGIRNFVARGLRPQVILSVMRRNVHQIDAVVRLAESLGAAR